MKNREKIHALIIDQGRVTTPLITQSLGVSRQYVSAVIAKLVADGLVIKLGGTRNAFYVSRDYLLKYPDVAPTQLKKTYANHLLEEHKVLIDIEEKLPVIATLLENVRSIFTFAFSEMLNNAIEHSQSKSIVVEVAVKQKELSFAISDHGIGAFRNIMKKKKLHSETEAIQDLLKGKTTTMLASHSGEGIFFTSKASDLFTLNSFGLELLVNTKMNDVAIHHPALRKRGTLVAFRIRTDSDRHLNDVFRKYTNLTDESDFGFDKTEIRVKLFTVGGVLVSRSQARRVLAGLEKFKSILFDYENVPMVGQAFADEIYRVFHELHPTIQLENEHMSEGVQFMVLRAINEARKAR